MALKRLVLAAFSALLLSTGFGAAATCDLSFVDGATMCEDGSTNNDGVGGNEPLQVNQDSIFGISDWAFLGKPSNDGTYSVGTEYDMYMVVLKGPNPDPYQAYKVDPGSSGEYNLSAFDGQRVSHISIYGAAGMSEVPLPAAGFLLIAGLGGLALFRRKG